MYAPDRPFTPEERQRVEQSMQATYEAFVEKAASGRNTTPEKIDQVAQGRVWTGLQAKQIGLVDELGGLDRALTLAKQRAKIDEKAEVELVIYPQRKSFYELVQAPFGTGSEEGLLARLVGLRDARAVKTLTAPLRLFRRGEPLAIMPNVFVR
jgi:protease-4